MGGLCERRSRWICTQSKEIIKAIKEEEERLRKQKEAEEAERLRKEREQQEKLRLQKQKEAEEAERLRKERELREKQKLLQQKKAEQERLLKERAQKEQEERQKEQERQAQIAMEKFFQGIILCILTVIWIIGVSKGFLVFLTRLFYSNYYSFDCYFSVLAKITKNP